MPEGRNDQFAYNQKSRKDIKVYMGLSRKLSKFMNEKDRGRVPNS